MSVNILFKLRKGLVTIALGAGGGWLAELGHIPLGWMVGAIIAVGMATIAGARLYMPGWFRYAVMAVIGVYLAESFRPDVLNWLGKSAVTLPAMLTLVLIETLVATYAMRKWVGCDKVSAITASVPGGFSTMLVIAGQYRGDVAFVSFVQLIRVLLVIGLVSFTTTYLGMKPVDEPLVAIRDFEYATLIMLVGLIIGMMFKLPILCMMVPFVAGAVLQVFSITHFTLPEFPLAGALVILGVSVGLRWGELRGVKFGKYLLAGIGLSIFLIGSSVLAAWILSLVLDFELLPLILALVPGGVSEVSLIAVAMNIEAPFVVLHHLVRVTFILLIFPFLLSFYKITKATTC